MPKIFNKEQRKNINVQEENLGDEEDKDNLIEESIDSIISSSESETKKIEKIHKYIKEKKVVIDL